MAHLEQYIEQRTPEGSRNNALFRAVLEAREHGWHESDIRSRLGGCAARDGLGNSEIEETINSAFRKPVTLKKQTRRVGGHALGWDSFIGGNAARAMDQHTDALPTPRATWQTDDMREFLEALFFEGEHVSYNTSFSQNEKGELKPAGYGQCKTQQALIAEGVSGACDEAGVWVRLNPMDGKGIKDENVTDYRHVLVESDSLPIDEQWRILQALKVPCAAVVHSGGKSLHAAVSIEAGEDRAEYDRRVKQLYDLLTEHGLVVDKQNKNPSRLSRLPGVTRKGQPQYLLGTNLGCSSWDAWQEHIRVPEVTVDEEEPPLRAANLSGWATDEAPSVPWCFLGTVPDQAVTGVTGAPATGKSNFAAGLLISRAVGKTLYPAFQPQGDGPVMWIENEDPELQVRRMVRRIFDGFALDSADVQRFERNTTVYCEQNCVLAVGGRRDGREVIEETKRFDQVRRIIEAKKPSLILLNPRVSLAHIDENSNTQVDGFFQKLRGLLHINPSMAILLVHHSSKAGKDDTGMSAGRGAFAAAGALRAEFTLTTVQRGKDCPDMIPESEAHRYVRVTMSKQSYGEQWRDPVYLMREQGRHGGLLKQVFLPTVPREPKRDAKTEATNESARMLAVLLGENKEQLTQREVREGVLRGRKFKNLLCDRLGRTVPKNELKEAYNTAEFHGWIAVSDVKLLSGQIAAIPIASREIIEAL